MKRWLLALLGFDCLALLALCARDRAVPERAIAAPPVLRAALPLETAAATPAVPASGGVQWFATWESGLEEARRTGRPILLVAATPHCAGVSGMW